MNEADGELVAQAALDAIAAAQERYLTGELVRIEVRLVLDVPSGRRYVSVVKEKS